MKTAALILAAALLTGCAAVPYETAARGCDLLQIAATEADLAPFWYIEAGRVLESCGHPNARVQGEVRACFSEARNGYRDHKECEALP